MKSPLRILHLEDSCTDAEMVESLLEADGIPCEIRRVETCDGFEAALGEGEFDLIISDFALPSYDGTAALLRAREVRPDVPFLFFSGTIGEEAAIAGLKSGAIDYVLKTRVRRLPSAVRRVLQEIDARHERQRAERALRESQERLREQAALIDRAHDAILVCDLADQITYWNNGATRLYGWTPGEALGKKVYHLIYHRQAPPFPTLRAIVMDHDEWQGELHQVNKAGKAVIVESHWSLVRSATGEPRAVLTINYEVTERKQIEAQSLHLQRREGIGTLAGGIAHNLNNVLSPVLLAVQLLRQKLPDPAGQELLERLELNVQRGAHMIKQVLAFARGTEGERAVVQMGRLISDEEKIVQDTFPPSIRVEKKSASDLWPIMGEPTQLSQILLNLCVNARDAMPNGGTLSIGAENIWLDERWGRRYLEAKAGPYVLLTVSDTGTGIAPHILHKIFDPFFTTKELGKGTGLGLSTVFGIVKGHRGFIDVHSEMNKGTQFSIYLPAILSSGMDTAAPQPTELPPGNGELVLVVDDEETVCEITMETLSSYGYHVLTANDGTEALSIYARRQSDIDLVITDMAMPFMDGAATIRALQKMDPEVKILAISGRLENAKIAQAASNKAITLLPKPYTIEHLLNAVRDVLQPPGVGS
jgi:two-component system cell cycle sensor histidine kinase/response regulator CckA